MRLRAYILDRDRHRCQWPGCNAVATHVDHVIALSRGGTDDPTNLQALCEHHNLRKGDR